MRLIFLGNRILHRMDKYERFVKLLSFEDGTEVVHESLKGFENLYEYL